MRESNAVYFSVLSLYVTFTMKRSSVSQDLQPFKKMASAFGVVCDALNMQADKDDVYRILKMALAEELQTTSELTTQEESTQGDQSVQGQNEEVSTQEDEEELDSEENSGLQEDNEEYSQHEDDGEEVIISCPPELPKRRVSGLPSFFSMRSTPRDKPATPGHECTHTKTYTLYCLALQDPENLHLTKVYVGKTPAERLEERLQEHFDRKGKGSEWTKQYAPVRVMWTKENCDGYDEDKETLKLMEQYGYPNVRGGQYCQRKFTQETIDKIVRSINAATDRCLKCGSSSHFVMKCTARNVVPGQYSTPL